MLLKINVKKTTSISKLHMLMQEACGGHLRRWNYNERPRKHSGVKIVFTAVKKVLNYRTLNSSVLNKRTYKKIIALSYEFRYIQQKKSRSLKKVDSVYAT